MYEMLYDMLYEWLGNCFVVFEIEMVLEWLDMNDTKLEL